MIQTLPPGVRARFGDLRPLGGGQQGAAVAVDRVLGEKVVLKPLARGEPGTAVALEVLRRAASPHLPAVLDVVYGEGRLWIVTRFVEGRSAAHLVQTQGALGVVDAARIAAGVARALGAVHAAGTHHGDVSPWNVVVSQGDRAAVLVDLGQVGSLGSGTPGFLAPEVLAGGGGPAADLYALGAFVWYLLRGTPFERSPARLAALDAGGVAERVAQAACEGGWPRGLVEVLVRLLDPDPARRPRDARAVAAVIEGWTRGEVGVRPRLLPPSHWPYVGDLEGVLEIARGRPRLAVVIGEEGAGARRLLAEVAIELSSRGTPVQRVDLARAWQEWAAAPSESVLVVAETVSSPEELARLTAAAAVARAGLWCIAAKRAVEEATDGTGGTAGPIRWVRVPPVEPEHLGELARAAGAADPQAWGIALFRTCGGAAGRAARLLRLAAREGLAEPDPVRLARLAARGERARIPLEEAAAALREVWGMAEGLGEGRGSGGGPSARSATVAAYVAARQALGPEVRQLARAALASIPAGRVASPLVYLDAGDLPGFERWVAGTPLLQKHPAWSFVLAVLDEQPPAGLAPQTRARLASALLASGQAERALRVAPVEAEEPAVVAQGVRALLRLGRLDEARRAIERLASIEGGRTHAAMLELRLAVDAGEYDRARSLADGFDPVEAGADPVRADAVVLGAFARLATGAPGEALALLSRLADTGADLPAAVRARVNQVRGSAHLVRDEVLDAWRAFREAGRAYEDAGDEAGRLSVEAASAGLSVLVGGGAEELDAARQVVAVLAGRGQYLRAVETSLALVQLLVRHGSVEEAEQVTAILRQGIADEAPLVAARLLRMDAEVTWGKAVVHRNSGLLAEAAEIAGRAAERFEEAGATREAFEAHLRAATAWARMGVAERARAALGRGEAVHPEPTTAERLAWSAAACETAAAAGSPQLATAAFGQMAAAGPLPEVLLRRGRLDVAADLAESLVRLSAVFGVDPALVERFSSACRALRSRLRKHPIMTKPDPIEPWPIDTLASASLAGSTGPRDAAAAGPDPRRARLERIVRAYRRLAHEEDVGRLLEQVVDAMMDVTGAERGAVILRGEDGDTRVVHRGLGEAGLGALSQSVLARVLDEGEPVVSVDAMEDARFERARSVSHLNLRSILAVPLRFHGRCLGAAYVDHRLRRGHFGDEDLEDMETFADLAATAVAHARTLAELREKARALARREADLAERLASREAEVEGLRGRAIPEPSVGAAVGIVGASPPILRLLRLVERVAPTDVPVIVVGESGTGKELVARALHARGGRPDGPFVAENCGAIPATLIEGVLFGHAKGAFTGADRARAGLFEAASGGTLFLDEVAELPLDVQSKLLRVLQEGKVRRLGETRERPVHVRIVAATHRDLDAMVAAGTFREDLYYRLHVVRVRVPPLRERREDLPVLIEHFLARYGGKGLRVSPDAMARLTAYDWPGNVRELENEVRRWIVLCEGEVTEADLSARVRGKAGEGGPLDLSLDGENLPAVLGRVERAMIERALRATGGNVSAAARRLGVSRYGLHKKMDRLGIDPHVVCAGP